MNPEILKQIIFQKSSKVQIPEISRIEEIGADRTPLSPGGDRLDNAKDRITT
jgi:hypothetical protein